MIPASVMHWRGDAILSSDLAVAGERTAFYSAVHRGDYTAIYRGVYVPTSQWSTSSGDSRYLMRLRGAAQLDPDVVFSHHSAAALWRLPTIGGWPRHSHVFRAHSALAARTSTFLRHTSPIPDELELIDGLRVTRLARTVLDIAVAETYGQAVVMADAALHRSEHPIPGLPRTLVTVDDLLHELSLIPTTHGSARARRVIEFADGRADRPGESMSRVAMDVAHLPPPHLQVTLHGASGRTYVVDFWWPEANLIGEFDGNAKYSDPEFLRGRTPEQALRDEKAREDDLRAAGHRMSRWGWRVALEPRRLRDHLLTAGLSDR